MLIDIKPISRSAGAALAIELEISPDDLDLTSLGYRLSRPLEFRGLLQNTGNGILALTGRIQAGYEGDCARCLTTVGADLEIAVSDNFQPGDDAGDEKDELTYRYSGGCLDISQAMRDNLIPSLPARMICREDCPGLCPDCGTNHNVNECGCAAGRESKVSPFGRLKELL